jgi:hypothetical protein
VSLSFPPSQGGTEGGILIGLNRAADGSTPEAKRGGRVPGYPKSRVVTTNYPASPRLRRGDREIHEQVITVLIGYPWPGSSVEDPPWRLAGGYPIGRVAAICRALLRDSRRPLPRDRWACQRSSNFGSSPMSGDQSTSRRVSSKTYAEGPDESSSQLLAGPYAITCCLPSMSTAANRSTDGRHAR